MASFRLEWKRVALKELKTLPPDTVRRLVSAVESLAENPYPEGCKKLAGSQHTYRIREGSYRVLYNVLTDLVLVEIVKIGHRKDVYR